MSKSTHNARGALRPLLCFLLVACIGGAGWLGVLAYREYRDRQDGLDFYQALVKEGITKTARPLRTAFSETRCAEGEAIQTAAASSTPLPMNRQINAALPTAQLKNVASPQVTPSPQVEASPQVTPSLQAETSPQVTPSLQAETSPQVIPSSQAEASPQVEPSQQDEVEMQETAAIQPHPDRISLSRNPSELDFAALQASYPDVVGWIRLDDTIIDYPIVHGEDNDFYLHHLPDGTANESGCIMMDCSNDPDFGDDVIILHGHHMRNGSMFSLLDAYEENRYYEQHPMFRLLTPYGAFDVAVAAAYTVDVETFDYPINFADEEQFEVFWEEALCKTRYLTGVRPVYGDQLLMLSTCNYSFSGARFIVLGKILPEQME